MPSISCFPPAPLSPEAGSYTPIFTVSAMAAAERTSIIANTIANTFFMGKNLLFIWIALLYIFRNAIATPFLFILQCTHLLVNSQSKFHSGI